MTEFQQIIEEMIDRKSTFVVVAKVDKVNEANLTFDCNPVSGGAPITEVRIKPIVDSSEKGVIVIPKIGSLVSILSMSAAQWVLHQCADWDRVEILSNQAKVKIKASGEVLIESPDITFGGVAGAEPIVKGNELGNRISEIYSHLQAIQNALLAMGTTGAAASVGPLAPFLASFTTLTTTISAELPSTVADRAKYPLVKSSKVKTS